jgi:hypothetical protein
MENDQIEEPTYWTQYDTEGDEMDYENETQWRAAQDARDEAHERWEALHMKDVEIETETDYRALAIRMAREHAKKEVA